MLDPEFIRNEPDKVKEGAKLKGFDPGLVDSFIDFDESL